MIAAIGTPVEWPGPDRLEIEAAFLEGCCPVGHRLTPVTDSCGDCLTCDIRITRILINGLPGYTLQPRRLVTR